ncbi:hypothetical protein OUZ56_012062 [Daphnia magna]|uniref:Uncharacterized protein n=1 Tax=Daphnia magna TaxID=35525 RepID=A0ABQ9Z1X4_9CRUS|nr:hypothetical protein OUZ56_012062 [Daphnia magna]
MVSRQQTVGSSQRSLPTSPRGPRRLDRYVSSWSFAPTYTHGIRITFSIYGLGGGEAAHLHALVTLKQNYGGRDVVRAAHIQALEKLEIHKNDPALFKREIAAADIIERICFKLQLNDRLAWNADKGSGIETIGLDQFGTWLCNRVATYQNASSIAADQLNGDFERKRDKQHSRSNKTRTETSDKNIYTSGSS